MDMTFVGCRLRRTRGAPSRNGYVFYGPCRWEGGSVLAQHLRGPGPMQSPDVQLALSPVVYRHTGNCQRVPTARLVINCTAPVTSIYAWSASFRLHIRNQTRVCVCVTNHSVAPHSPAHAKHAGTSARARNCVIIITRTADAGESVHSSRTFSRTGHDRHRHHRSPLCVFMRARAFIYSVVYSAFAGARHV